MLSNKTFFFLSPDISASSWLADRGYNYSESYPTLVHSELMEYLGLSKYLLEEECSITSELYSGNTNGWKQGNTKILLNYSFYLKIYLLLLLVDKVLWGEGECYIFLQLVNHSFSLAVYSTLYFSFQCNNFR